MLSICLTAVIALSCTPGEGPATPEPPPPPPVLSRVELSLPAVEFASIDRDTAVSVKTLDSSGQVMSGVELTWSSSDTLTFVALGDGRIRSVGTGSAVLTVSASSNPTVRDSAAVTVRRPVPRVNECVDAPSEWIWCDDFEEDRLSGYYEYNARDGGFARTGGVGVGGSTGMRAQWTRMGQSEAGNLKVAFGRVPHSRFRPVDDGTTKYRDIYWRMWVKKGAGWEGGGADKLSRATAFASGNYAQAMIAHVWSGNAPNHHEKLVLDPASGTSSSGTLRSTKYNDWNNLRWLGLTRGNTRLFAPPSTEEWHCIEARVRLNDAGASNGTFLLWLNGRLEARKDGLNWLGSYDAYGINAVMFENYWNDGPPKIPLERYFDNLVVSTKRIGC